MQRIPLSLAAPEMVLAKAVRKDDDDMSPPICGKGVVLTAALISRLEKMGIQAVTVEGRPVIIEGEQSIDEALKLLDRRFIKVTDDPLMASLKDIYKRHIVKSMGGEDGG